MKYRIEVNIDGRRYALTAAENDGYIEKVAEYVDTQIKEVGAAMRSSAVDSATMAAMNIADSFFQEKIASAEVVTQLIEAKADSERLRQAQGSTEDLRRRLSNALAESNASMRETADLRQQLEEAQKEIDALRAEAQERSAAAEESAQALKAQLEEAQQESAAARDQSAAAQEQIAALEAQLEQLKAEQDGSGDLRRQLKDALDENSRLRKEIVRMGRK